MKRIPGFSGYKISRTGILIRIKDNVKLNWHKSNGYRFVKIIDDFGNRVSIGRHRALALAYIPLPNTAEKVEVNHINGIRGDDRLDNLEWVTRSQNAKHAALAGLTNAVKSVVVDLSTKQKQMFPTQRALADFLGIDYSVLTNIKNNKGRKFVIGNYRIEFLTESYLERKHNPYPRGVCARNIVTNKVIHCDTVNRLGTLTGICSKVIARTLRQGGSKYPVYGHDLRIYQSDLKWPIYSDDEILAYKDSKFIHNPIWIIDKDGTKTLFDGPLSASKHTKTHQRVIRWCIANNKPCARGFEYRKHKKAGVSPSR